MSIFEDQAMFMHTGGQQISSASPEQQELYVNLVGEEVNEFLHATICESEACQIKEAIDLIVVTAGFLVSKVGFRGAEEAWRLVHATNMAKVDDGFQKRPDGKIMKSEKYLKMKDELLDKLGELV